MKNIAISGASGFVGQHLTQFFNDQGYKVIKIERKELKNLNALTKKINGTEALINLAGANILQRWNRAYKKLPYSSRIDTTKALVKAMSKSENPPKVFISTSAIGIYKDNKIYDETDTDFANTFLANLCKDWEDEAKKAENYNVRTVLCRFGIVLSSDGGALQRMIPPFKLGLGGIIGSGQQIVSFIHIEDLKRFYLHAITNNAVQGIYNMATPYPTTNRGLTKGLGKALNRPTILPLPSFVVRIIFGEGASILTKGQNVRPKRVLESGYTFEFETMDEIMDDLL